MRVLLFDGQGATQAASSSSTTSPVYRPLSALFVRQANDLLRTRVLALSPETVRSLDTGATRSLLSNLRNGRVTLPTSEPNLLHHPLISLPSVYVSQVACLFEQLEAGVEWHCPTIDVVGYSSGLLSALLVATSLPAPSEITSPLSPSVQLTLLRNALAILEVSIMLGVEAQITKLDMLRDGGVIPEDPNYNGEWSAVLFNETREMLEAKIQSWNADTTDALHRIHLTAQTTATCHSISGLPPTLKRFIQRQLPEATLSASKGLRSFSRASSIDSLRATAAATSAKSEKLHVPTATMGFDSVVAPKPLHSQVAAAMRASNISLPPSPSPSLTTTPVVKSLEIFTLFHVNDYRSTSVRDRIISSIFTQAAVQPTKYFTYPQCGTNSSNDTPTRLSLIFSSLRLTPCYVLYDTHEGTPIPSHLPGKDLISLVIDRILCDCVEFLKVLKCISGKAKTQPEVKFVNYGPGNGLVRTIMRSLKEQSSSSHLAWSDCSSVPRSETVQPRTQDDDAIAIVGMALDFPGARNGPELWRLLEKGMNTVEEIPRSRFSVSSYLETNPNAKPTRKMRTRFGNFLADGVYDGFDNSFFRISPKEARALDPQMRLLMRVGFNAVESAGLVVNGSDDIEDQSLRPEEVGCFVGVATNDYALNLKNDVGVHYATGTLPAFLAGRLAYALNLSGPSVVTNTACSSSLVAIHQACKAIIAGDCRAALAGGVNVITSPDMYIGLDRGHFLSPTGNCKPWDASADGYCRSEGCGMFVLKRLSDALESSDNIIGVIRATEINQSSSATSITRPHAPTQEFLIQKLLAHAGLKGEDVNLVEAHGTGTQAGDPEELKSLRAVLSPNNGSERSEDNMLTVTSIKANLGHAEAASGAVSLAKILLMFKTGKIPTQIGLTNLNPKIEPLENDFTRINLTGVPIDWTPNMNGKRIALLNNFGAAGSNAAALVEQPPSKPQASEKDTGDHVLVCLSADNESALLRLRDAYTSSLTDTDLVDFSYTTSTRRKIRPWRIAVSAPSADEMAKKLQAAQPMKVSGRNGASIPTVFLFSGQGGQHLGMGRQLYHTSKIFRSIIESCHSSLVEWGYPGITAIIDCDGKGSGLREADELIAYQCALFTIECALRDLWESWGVKADAVAGHSLGEYAALVAAGVITLKDGLRLVAYRVRLMTEQCIRNNSGMLLVRQSEEFVRQVISLNAGCEGVEISCYNAPEEIVIGGSLSSLHAVKEKLEASSVKCVMVNVPFAYHTSAMNPILDDFEQFACNINFNAPRIPIVSNVTGEVVAPGVDYFNSGYLASHCREPVRFTLGLGNLVASMNSIGTFVEIGPHPTTLPMIKHLSVAKGIATLQSLHKKMSARTALLSSLAQLFTTSQNISWSTVFHELYPSAHCIEIPNYPLQETSFWTPYVEESHSSESQPIQNLLKRFPFLGTWVNQPSSRDGNVSEFETPIEQIAEYIIGHNVASVPLCPASVYSELAMSASTCTMQYAEDNFNDLLTLSDMQFTHPLLYDASSPVVIRTSINLHPRGGKHAGTFTISSFWNGVEQHVHCTGFFQRRERETVSAKLQLHSGHVQRGKTSLLDPVVDTYHETLRTRTIYDLIFPRVVQYSKLYQVITSMTIDERNGEAIATIRIPQERSDQTFVLEPVFFDALLHAAGFLINSRASSSDAYICSQVDSTKIVLDTCASKVFEIYCTTSSGGDGLILADAWAVEVGGSSKIVAHVKRMRFSRVRLSGLQKSLSRTAGSPRPSTPFHSPSHLKPSEISSRPVTPAMLGSPFRAIQRAGTPSSLSSVTAVNSIGSDPTFDILKIFAEVCGVSVADVKPSSNMADLGVDSLLWIELTGHLKSIFPNHHVEMQDLMECETVGDLVHKFQSSNHHSVFGLKKMSSFASFSTPCSKRPSIEFNRAHTPSPALVLPSVGVKDVIAKVLEIPACDLRGDEFLEELGLDSLGSIEAIHELQLQFKVELPSSLFRDYPTITSVETYIVNLSESYPVKPSPTFIEDEPIDVTESSLLPLQKTPAGGAPFFLIHDGSGLSSCYSRIGNLSRSLWGISNPKLATGESWRGGIPEMAANYAKQIKAVMGSEGCILGGWSFGGVVAFHAACQLINEGVKVSGVVLIDSPSPLTKDSLPGAIIKKVIGSDKNAPSRTVKQAKTLDLARIQMTHATNALVAYDPLSSSTISNASATFPNVVMIRCEDAFPIGDLEAIPTSESMSFLCSRDDPKTITSDWEKLTGKPVPILDIPGHHFEPFEKRNVSVLTQQLKKAMAYFEAL